MVCLVALLPDVTSAEVDDMFPLFLRVVGGDEMGTFRLSAISSRRRMLADLMGRENAG